MAQHRGRLLMLVEVTQDFADLLVLHQVDDRCLAAGNEDPIIAVQALVEDRAQRAPLHRRVSGVKDLGVLIGVHVATEMRRRIRGLVDRRRRAIRRGEHDLIAGIDERHHRHDRFIDILAGSAPIATPGLDARCIRADDDDLSFTHDALRCGDLRKLQPHI